MKSRQASQSPVRELADSIRHFSVRVLNILDFIAYALVGIAFIFAAGFALWYSIANLSHGIFGTNLPKDIAKNILGLVSDLLLVIIILEVMGTIRSYLDTGNASVKPFLFIGIVSATRGILSIGAQLSILGSTITPDEFQKSMIELAVNSFIIIALGTTVRIMGNFAVMMESEEHKSNYESKIH